MGCCNNPNYQDRAARESINNSVYRACQCATEACECKNVALQVLIAVESSAESASSDAYQSQAIWNDFQTRYLGASTTNPVTTSVGALYFNTISNAFFVWNGLSWQVVTGTGTVTNVATGTGLTGGPIGTTGTISLANTSVVSGNYTNSNITVDSQGRITLASNGTNGTLTSIIAGTGLNGGTITSSGTISANFGTTSGTICAGNDSRVVNAATQITNSSAITLSPTQGVITSIPSYVKRITFHFQDVVVSGGSDHEIVIQFGYGATPTYLTSGYISAYTILGSSGATEGNVAGVGFSLYFFPTSGFTQNGSITFTLVDSSVNKWSASGIYAVYNSSFVPQQSYLSYGRVDLGAGNNISAIKIFPQSSQKTFTAGSIIATFEN